MSLEKIKETVMQASAAEAERIHAAAQKDARERLEAKKNDLLRELEYQYQVASRQMEEEYAKKLAVFQGNAAKELLEAKNASLRSILETAHRTVLALTDEEYGNVMRGFLEKISGGKKGSVRVHADDAAIFSSVLREINRARTEDAQLALDDERLHTKGGFIFISEEFEVDATLETIFSDIERSILPEIAEDLARL